MTGESGSRVEIRKIERKDCRAAAGFCEMTLKWSWDKYLKDAYPKEGLEFEIESLSSRRLEERLADPDKFAFIAVDHNKVCGIVVGTVYGKSGVAQYKWLAVHPDWHHEGIGLKLLIASEEHLKKRGCHKLTLNTYPGLAPAIKLLMKFGLLPEAFLRNAWWGADFMVMSKWISSYGKK